MGTVQTSYFPLSCITTSVYDKYIRGCSNSYCTVLNGEIMIVVNASLNGMYLYNDNYM